MKANETISRHNYDRDFMNLALKEAYQGLGHVSPNPLVGAILVNVEGQVIGRGFHAKAGGPHAEVVAITDAKSKGHNITGATLYVNLEPCSHENKKTPPCAPLLVQEKIAKVVVANIDPNPHVSGRGLHFLKENGVEVVSGVLWEKGEELNEIFFKNMRAGMPFVYLKMAQTLDGHIAFQNQNQKNYLSGAESLNFVHELRQKFDGLCIGRKTAELDNPKLNVRSAHFKTPSHPLRVIFTNSSHINLNLDLFHDELKDRTVIVTSNRKLSGALEKLECVKLMMVGEKAHAEENFPEADLNEALVRLYHEFKMTSLLVEGGGRLATSFLRQGAVDKMGLILTPYLIGNGVRSIVDFGCDSKETAIVLKNKKIRELGDDILIEGSIK